MLLITLEGIRCQTFVPGKHVESRRGRSVKASDDCSVGSNGKSFCNGGPNPICDAAGFVASLLLIDNINKAHSRRSYIIFYNG